MITVQEFTFSYGKKNLNSESWIYLVENTSQRKNIGKGTGRGRE